MFRLIAICCLAVVASFAAAHAQESQSGQKKPLYVDREEAVGLARGVYLVVEDQATGKCWTNIKRGHDDAKLLLEQNGIVIFPEPLAAYTVFNPAVQILVLATRSESGFCVGKINVNVYHASEQVYGESSEYIVSTLGQLWSRSAIMGNDTNLNDQILDWIDTMMTEYAADVVKKRQGSAVKKMLSDFPDEGVNPMTLVEWNRSKIKSR